MYYLIEHNRTNKETQYKEYSDYTSVQSVGLQKELHHFQSQNHEMEVVVFEANSIDELKRTHSRYFVNEQKDNAAGALVAVGLVALAVLLLNKK